jgi:hypothetical protein
MDMDPIKKRFLCKELGLIKVGNAEAKSFFFDIGLRWDDASPLKTKIPAV